MKALFKPLSITSVAVGGSSNAKLLSGNCNLPSTTSLGSPVPALSSNSPNTPNIATPFLIFSALIFLSIEGVTALTYTGQNPLPTGALMLCAEVLGVTLKELVLTFLITGNSSLLPKITLLILNPFLCCCR